jgi:CubicO group peptidase (beta-lactamase class C family)
MVKEYDFSKIGIDNKKRIEKGILPGVNLAIGINGKRVYEYNDGYSDIEKKTPLRKDDLFRLASMTKPITATAILILQDRGLVNIKDNISKYIPKFKRMYIGKLDDNKNVVKNFEALREITIEDILTHSSGLCSGEVGEIQYKKLGHKEGKNLKQTVEDFSKMFLDFSPGTSQLYSGAVALDVVARIVEIVSKMPYEEFLKENIFNPLQMKDTTYTLNVNQYKRLVKMYRLSDDVKYLNEINLGKKGHDLFPEGYTGGTAGLFSTLDDYMNFTNMLCNKGQFNNKRIISEQAVKMMATPHFENGFAGMNDYFNWGYAVRTVNASKDDVQMLSKGSFGWSGAYNTHFWVDPVQHLSAVYMSNMDNSGGAGAITAFEFECETMYALRKDNKK